MPPVFLFFGNGRFSVLEVPVKHSHEPVLAATERDTELATREADGSITYDSEEVWVAPWVNREETSSRDP